MLRGDIDDQRQDDLARMGVDAEEARQWIEQHEPQDAELDSDGAPPDGAPGGWVPGAPVLVWPCNVPVYRVFMALQTQWQRSLVDGRYQGLPYHRVEACLNLLGVRKGRVALFEQLQQMEYAVVQACAGVAVD